MTSRGIQVNKQLPIGAANSSRNGHQTQTSDDLLLFHTWDPEQVAQWLVSNDFGMYKDCFLQNQIAGDQLLDLNYAALKDIGVLIVGDRARILQAIKKAFNPSQLAPKSSMSSSSKFVDSSEGESRKSDESVRKKAAVSFANSIPAQPQHVNTKVTHIPLTRDGANANRDALNAYNDREHPFRNQNFRNRGQGAAPLVIFPRSSSIKDGPQTPQKQFGHHKDLSDAVDSVFGNSSNSITTPTSPALSPTSMKVGGNRARSNSNMAEDDPDDKGKTDIMKLNSVRIKCVRVHGQENQSHIIKVDGLQSAEEIESRIYAKFGVGEVDAPQLFIIENEALIPLNKEELLKICQTDNEHRANLYLRKMAGLTTSPGTLEPQDSSRSNPKLKKFFGSDVNDNVRSKANNLDIIFSSKSKQSKLFQTPQAVGKLGRFVSFFGERPPDEMIVDQLESYFPTINSTKDKQSVQDTKAIKNIIEENMKKKRSSNRQSSLMLRRMTKKLSIADIKPKESYQIPTIEAIKEALSPGTAETPQPINFRWAPGRIIGQGAFGKVFHALNLETGDFMAVKQVLHGAESQQGTKFTDSLQREIELLRDLDHENIVRYLGFEDTPEAFNVFLEYVAGGSISSCIAKCGKFPDSITRSITAQILCGLEYLHGRDIIHRDIKGANILLTADGIVKITDFGISKKNEYAAYHRMTRMSMQGSIYWMAPEVARGKGYSAKVDIWSLGCIVLEMLTAKLPWHKVRGNVIYLLGTGNSPPIAEFVSPLAKEFLKSTFILDPEERPTASTLLDHEFSDIDPNTVDFFRWCEEAMQRKLEEGTTSEEPSSEEEEEEEEDEFDEDEFLDEEEEV